MIPKKSAAIFLSVLLIVLASGGVGNAAEERCKLTGDASKCAQCKRPAGDHAASRGAYTKGGAPDWVFDDMACLLIWRDAKCMPTQVDLDGRLYVRDYETNKEVKATAAFYVVDSGVETPAGSGIVAVADERQARSFAAARTGAQVLSYEKLTIMDLSRFSGK